MCTAARIRHAPVIVSSESHSASGAASPVEGGADVTDGVGVTDGMGVADGTRVAEGAGVMDGVEVADGVGVTDGLGVGASGSSAPHMVHLPFS